MAMKQFHVVATCFALMACAEARAEDSGFYVGAGAGLAHEGFTGFRGDDTAFKLLGGYSFNKYFAMEAEYVDGGRLKDGVGGLDIAISSEGFITALIGKWPLNEVFAPYLKAGYAFYDTTAKVTGASSPFSVSSSDSDTVVGGGLELQLGDHFQLRAELEKINVPDADFRIYTLAATYRF
jgi:OmpA-OmpF porin, OOP family